MGWGESPEEKAERELREGNQRGLDRLISKYEKTPYQNAFTDDMRISPEMDQRLSGMRGFNRFESEALRSGPSAWARQATALSHQQEQDQRNALTRDAAGQAAAARSDLASRGGLTSGARERLAQNAQLASMMGAQDVARAGGQNRMNIGMQDEQNRMQMLSQLPGMEMQRTSLWANAKNQDITRQFTDNMARNSFEIEKIRELLKAAGLKVEADAIRESGK